ncbi:MAG: nitroreductase family protein [Ruminococcus sp.]|nr:nitroreductase family protein [Ruminococcus sp.]
MSFLSKVKRKLKVGNPVRKTCNRHYRKIKKYTFRGNKCANEKQYEAVITRWYHTIEKGLAYVNYRAGFGQKNINALLESMENYIDSGYSKDAFFYQTALSTLNAYIKKNKQHGVENKELEQRVSRLGGSGNEVGGVLQFTPLSSDEIKELNYKDFILDRHSMRHFSNDPVEIGRVKSAIKLAQHTPSACNRQGWRCLIISDRQVMKNVLKNQNGNEGFGQEFDKLLLVTADLRCFNRDREVFQAYIDGGMYAESVLNALHFEHIASVPLSASLTREQENNVRRILGLHDAEMLILFIGIGNYPDVCLTTHSERKPVTDIQVI